MPESRSYHPMRNRFLKFYPTREFIFHLFVIASVPPHFWGIINFLYRVPSYLLNLKTPEILVIFAYNQVNILFESLFLTIFSIVILLVLPAAWIGVHPVCINAIIIPSLALWLIAMNYFQQILIALIPGWKSFIEILSSLISSNLHGYASVNFLFFIGSLLWLISLFFFISISLTVLRNRPALAAFVAALPDRLSLLVAFLIGIDLISLLAIIIRNIA